MADLKGDLLQESLEVKIQHDSSVNLKMLREHHLVISSDDKLIDLNPTNNDVG